MWFSVGVGIFLVLLFFRAVLKFSEEIVFSFYVTWMFVLLLFIANILVYGIGLKNVEGEKPSSIDTYTLESLVSEGLIVYTKNNGSSVSVPLDSNYLEYTTIEESSAVKKVKSKETEINIGKYEPTLEVSHYDRSKFYRFWFSKNVYPVKYTFYIPLETGED